MPTGYDPNKVVCGGTLYRANWIFRVGLISRLASKLKSSFLLPRGYTRKNLRNLDGLYFRHADYFCLCFLSLFLFQKLSQAQSQILLRKQNRQHSQPEIK